MKKLTLTLLSSLFFMTTAHADVERKNLEKATLQFFATQTLTASATNQYLDTHFRADEDSLKTNATIIHSDYVFEEMGGMPYAFAFNQGNKVVGIAAAIDNDEGEAFFNKLSKLTHLNCTAEDSRFYDLKVCAHKSASPATVKKFKADFVYLMENAG